MSALDAASALAAGFARARVATELIPLGDGGQGTTVALFEALGFTGDWHGATVSGPLGHRFSDAAFLLLPDGLAIMDSSEAIGRWRLFDQPNDVLRASSRGLGELMAAAIDAGAKRILVGLGGSVTVDGGAGLREVLREFPIPVDVACDVRNPLLGERGAARVFGPQKGASPEEVEELERRLAGMEELVPYANLPGAGAAGGLGAALAAMGARLLPGSDLVLEIVRFRERIRGADLVVTGEGVVDETSKEGKITGAVVDMCRDEGIRCAVFAARIEIALEGAEMYEVKVDFVSKYRSLHDLGKKLGRSLR